MPGDLYYGDNLDVLRHKVASESVDLIYLDPPFNSDRTYNLIHKESQAQERAFHDSWHWDDSAEQAFSELTGHAPQGVRVPPALSAMLPALREFLGEKDRDMLAYLSMMAIRLVEMRRVLRPTGSLYLHCDPTASHYLRVILDTIFGPEQFRNEIVWLRSKNPKGSQHGLNRYSPFTDTIFYYVKSDAAPIVLDRIRVALDGDGMADKYPYADEHGPFADGPILRSDSMGERPNLVYEYKGFTPGPPGWRVKRSVLEEIDRAGNLNWTKTGVRRKLRPSADKGNPIGSFWGDIPPVNSQASERVGYPTQKPLPLLKRIIEASSNPGDLVLDPFCGCGTTVEAAEDLGRKWLGIDIAIRAIDVIKDRLDEKFQPRVWKEYGEPSDVDSAAHLADTNPYDFQWWAVRKLGGQPPKGEKKKGGDGGIDGEMTLRDFDSSTKRRVVISVKGGRTLTPDMVKALKSTVDLEKVDYGILVTMHSPTPGMKDVARAFGAVPWSPKTGKIEHRIRIVTVPEILAGTVRLPGVNQTPRSHSSPPPAEARLGENLRLPFPAQSSAKGQPRKTKPYRTPEPQTIAVSDKARPSNRKR